MNYFACPLHNGHYLSLVCTEKSCNVNSLICRINYLLLFIIALCEHADHQSHNTLPIKLML